MDTKLYYTIGEVAEMMETSTSQLRYWSGEFSLNVRKNRKGDRLFQKEDLERLQLIQRMLKDEGYTIDGAKKKLKGAGKSTVLQMLNEPKEEIDVENDKSIYIKDVVLKLKTIRNDLEAFKRQIHVKF